MDKRLSQYKQVFVGKYKELRMRLDYNYHENYSEERQLFQDQIIDSYLIELYFEGIISKNRPHFIYSAGAMGAGKSHTLRYLRGSQVDPEMAGIIKEPNYLMIDPDRFREMIPEYQDMKMIDPLNAPTFFHKECSILAEITLQLGLNRGYNIICDGSMVNYQWYIDEINRIRREHTMYLITIIYVDADWDKIVERVESRCQITGRCINREKLKSVWSKIPLSIEKLKPYVDEYYKIINNEEKPILVERETNEK